MSSYIRQTAVRMHAIVTTRMERENCWALHPFYYESMKPVALHDKDSQGYRVERQRERHVSRLDKGLAFMGKERGKTNNTLRCRAYNFFPYLLHEMTSHDASFPDGVRERVCRLVEVVV